MVKVVTTVKLILGVLLQIILLAGDSLSSGPTLVVSAQQLEWYIIVIIVIAVVVMVLALVMVGVIALVCQTRRKRRRRKLAVSMN